MDESKSVAIVPEGRVWWRDFGYYALRWTIIIAVLNVVTYTTVPTNAPAGYFWQAKLTQLLLGIGYGFLCAVAFTVAQNGLNGKRRKPLSWGLAIATLVAMNFLMALGTLGLFGSQNVSIPADAGIAANNAINDMRTKAAQEHPDRPVAYALHDEAVKQSVEDLSKETGAKKADMAAGQFTGFYLVNVRGRYDYCKTLGVDISPFVEAFKREHADLYTKSRLVHARSPFSPDTIENEMAKQLQPSFQKVISDAMGAMAVQNKVTEREVCSAFADHGEELATEFQLAKINPPLYQALQQAK